MAQPDMLASVLAKSNGPDVRGAVNRANDEAWNFQECGYHTPPGLTREEFWLLVALSRTSDRVAVPLRDLSGRPFTYRLPSAADRVLHLADKELAGTVSSPTPQLDSQAGRRRYLVRSLHEEAIASSLIEGAVVTREDAKRMLREKRPPRTSGERMVANNYDTIQMLNDRRGEPLSPELLCEIQRRLTQDTLDEAEQAGRFRRADEKIAIWDDTDNELVHSPPPADELPARIATLCEFANAQDDPARPGPFVHPVVRAAVLHFWLGFDHPFADGNGRTARALFYWCMLRNGYWLAEYLTISTIIRRQTTQYYMAFLDTEVDGNDLTYFIIYHLRVLERSLREFREYMDRKRAERGRLADAMADAPLNPRQRVLLARAADDPAAVFTYEGHAGSHGVQVSTARADLLALVALGLLRQNKAGRRFEFTPAPDLDRRLKALSAGGG